MENDDLSPAGFKGDQGRRAGAVEDIGVACAACGAAWIALIVLAGIGKLLSLVGLW